MKNLDRSQILIYSLVGLLCVGTSFLISLRFIGKTHAQEEQRPAAAPGAPAESGKGAPPAAATTPNPAPAPKTGGSSSSGNALSELEGFLEPFIYDQVNRRDPFLPYAEYQPQEGGGQQPTRPLSPAQRFDLDQLHLVGIMWDVKEPKAMFMDPESEVLVLGRDEGIGNKNGYIAAIREGEVVVVEAIRKRGDVIYKTRVLRMER